MNTRKHTFAKSAITITITIITVLAAVLVACGGSDAALCANTSETTLSWKLEYNSEAGQLSE